ncbi:MAG: DNA-3-methyladenine glycosylase 2 family protein [Alphaproteobacteria bacterium]
MIDESMIRTGLAALSACDDDLRRGVEQVGLPAPRGRDRGFGSLLAAIVSQQVSKEAAAAIWGRVQSLMPTGSPGELLSHDDDALRGAGLSRPKIIYARGLATAIDTGELDMDALAGMEDEAVIEALSSLKGIGRWTAEVYCLHALGRPDIFPADDLALLEALRRLKGLEDRPKPKQARDLIAHWSPWRSVGSVFLWHYYRGAPQ